MSNFGKTERKIKDLFLSEKKFTYEQANYSVLKCDKPTSSKGECKTDVYVFTIAKSKNSRPKNKMCH